MENNSKSIKRSAKRTPRKQDTVTNAQKTMPLEYNNILNQSVTERGKSLQNNCSDDHGNTIKEQTPFAGQQHVPTKKKPGRPRKNPVREHEPRKGISVQPHNIANHIEFIYSEPSVFKKLWGYYKAMAIEQLQLIFRQDEIIIYGIDHMQKSRMRTRIDARKVNHYYCKQPLTVGISNSNTENIMLSIDETYNKIAIYSESGSIHRNIKTTLTNEIEIDENRVINLVDRVPEFDDEKAFLDDDYTLKFELPGKYFKKMLTNIKLFSEELSIRQDGPNDPLMFEYQDKEKKIKSKNVVKNSKKIKLRSTLKDDTFLVKINLDYIKPISSALASENIAIWTHEKKPFVTSVSLDNDAVEIKILTDIMSLPMAGFENSKISR